MYNRRTVEEESWESACQKRSYKSIVHLVENYERNELTRELLQKEIKTSSITCNYHQETKTIANTIIEILTSTQTIDTKERAGLIQSFFTKITENKLLDNHQLLALKANCIRLEVMNCKTFYAQSKDSIFKYDAIDLNQTITTKLTGRKKEKPKEYRVLQLLFHYGKFHRNFLPLIDAISNNSLKDKTYPTNEYLWNYVFERCDHDIQLLDELLKNNFKITKEVFNQNCSINTLEVQQCNIAPYLHDFLYCLKRKGLMTETEKNNSLQHNLSYIAQNFHIYLLPFIRAVCTGCKETLQTVLNNLPKDDAEQLLKVAIEHYSEKNNYLLQIIECLISKDPNYIGILLQKKQFLLLKIGSELIKNAIQKHAIQDINSTYNYKLPNNEQTNHTLLFSVFKICDHKKDFKFFIEILKEHKTALNKCPQFNAELWLEVLSNYNAEVCNKLIETGFVPPNWIRGKQTTLVTQLCETSKVGGDGAKAQNKQNALNLCYKHGGTSYWPIWCWCFVVNQAAIFIILPLICYFIAPPTLLVSAWIVLASNALCALVGFEAIPPAKFFVSNLDAVIQFCMRENENKDERKSDGCAK